MSPSDYDNPPTGKYERYLRTDHLDADLRRRSVRGGAVTVGAQFIRHFVIALATTAILARLLTPADFGLLAMVAGLTNLLARFKDLGLAMATVQRKEITHDQVSTLFWVNVGLGVAATLVMAGFAPLVAWFYGEPRLTMITLALAAAFLFGGLTVQHRALLRRQMRFTVSSAVQIVSSIVGAIVGIWAALLGAGYWALVIMQLTSTVVSALGVWVVCGWRPGRLVRGAGVRSMLVFGGNLTCASLLNFLVRNLDNILIGWRWGADALGFYAKAYQLLLLPIRQLNGPLTSVAIPALSRLQDNPQRYRLFYQTGLQLLTTLGMPLVVFTLVAADKVVLLILGDQWTQAVPLFRALGPAAFLGTFNVATGWVYVSLGQTHRQLRWSIVGSTVATIGFIMALPWGPTAVAGALSLTSCTILYPRIAYCFRRSPLHVRDLFGAIWRPALASTAAGAALFLTDGTFLSPDALALTVAVDLGMYGLFYVLAWVLLPNGRATIRGIAGLLRDLRAETSQVEE